MHADLWETIVSGTIRLPMDRCFALDDAIAAHGTYGFERALRQDRDQALIGVSRHRRNNRWVVARMLERADTDVLAIAGRPFLFSSLCSRSLSPGWRHPWPLYLG